MSTYQPSTVNPNYFETNVFEAPTEFLYNVARQKQLGFDRGINAVRSEYQSMANLPVSSQFGLAKRDALMQEATGKLRKIAGADFSLDENEAAAHSVYKPITTDSDILYDLAQSKSAQKQISSMDKLQSSKDEKDRAMYWDTGREYVNNSIRKLQSAKTADQLHNTQVRDFVPYTDIVGNLNKAAADLKLKISLDHINGGYIITKENGEDAQIPFYLFAQSQLGTKDREVLKVLGTVEADHRVAQETFRNGGNELLARQTLATEAIKTRADDFVEQLRDNNKTLAKMSSKRKSLIESNGNVINDKIIDQLDQLDTQSEMIKQKNSSIDERIRDIGFNQFQGNYVQNAEVYNKTLSYYQNDLSVPYMETAAKNITMNWAAGLASATTTLSIKSDPNFIEGLKLQTEEIKARSKLVEEQAKATTGKAKTEKEPKPNYINDPLQLDNNPFGQEKMNSYDYFKQQKRSYETEMYGRGTDFIQDAGLGLSADFLTALSDNMKKGAATESITGISAYSLKDRPEFKEDIAKVIDMVQKGEITTPNGSLGHADLFEALMNRAKVITDDKLKNPPDDAEQLSHLVKLSKEVEQNLSAFRVFKDDENKINQKILASGKYQMIQGDKGQVLDREGFMEKMTGYKTAGEFMSHILSGSADDVDQFRKRLGYFGAMPISFIADISNSINLGNRKLLENLLGQVYNKNRSGFDKDFENFLNIDKPKFLSKLPMQNGQVGFTYPVQEWQLTANPDDKSEEIGEVALKRAFQPSNLTDETKILNMDQLGNKGNIMALANYVQGSLESDIKPDMGRVYTVQIGSDGKSPAVVFRPSVGFLKQFVSKGNPLDDATLEKVARNGIEIAADIPEIQKYRPSLVGRLIDIDKGYNVLPELKEEGFGARIEKQTNGRGYKIYLDYKTYDQAGKEVTEVRKDLHPDIYIPEQRLDTLAQGVINDILTQYINYKKQKKTAETPVQPLKTYTEEEYLKIRQQRH